MKRYLYSIISISFILIIPSCLENIRSDEFSEAELSGTVIVSVKMPEGYDYPVKGLKVILYDNTAGLQFKGITDEQGGVAEIRVAPGYYIASTETSFRDSGGILYLFNGMSEKN